MDDDGERRWRDAVDAFSWDEGPGERRSLARGPATVEREARTGEAPAGHGGAEQREPVARGAARPRRRAAAGAVLLAMLLGFAGGGLLDAATMKRDVQGMPLGARRSVALALLAPAVALSHAVGLDRPGHAIDAALGRTAGDHHTLSQAKAAKPLWPRPVTTARPLRLYVAGDSMAAVFGSSLVNLAEETGLVRAKLDYHVSTGLSRPDFFDWPQRLIDMLVERKPDAVVVLFGANDAQSVAYQGQVLKVGTMAWRGVYEQRVAQAMAILTESGRRVYWVGNPIMKDALYRDRIAMMDHIYAAEAARHPGVTYVSTWALMSGKGGSYASSLPGPEGEPVLMRAPDGIHLTRAGGDRMASAVLDVIAKDWDFKR